MADRWLPLSPAAMELIEERFEDVAAVDDPLEAAATWLDARTELAQEESEL